MIKFLLLIANFLSLDRVGFMSLIAQIPMADAFRSSGKIYVVLGVILIILIGLFVYLFRMDNRLNKIEKDLDNHKNNTDH